MTAKTHCSACGVEIVALTALKRGGLCAPCANGTRAQMDANRQLALVPRPPQVPAVFPSAAAITAALESIDDPEGPQDLAVLEAALVAVTRAPDPARCIPALFGVFERFPWDDGLETFWSILHLLESLPECDDALIASVRRAPGEFNLLMVRRLLNSGVTEVEGLPLRALFEEVASGTQYSDRAREEARDLLAEPSESD